VAGVVSAYVIPDDSLFDDEGLTKTLGIRFGSIEKARRSGELKYTRRGGRYLYTGKWVKDWLTHEEQPQPVGVGA
jgi:hypothetical protein